MTLKDRLAIAVFSLLLMFLLAAVLCVVAFVLAFRVGVSRFGVIVMCLSVMGCAHQPPPAPVVPVEDRITIYAYAPQHVVLCVENPDIWIATKPRMVCKRLIEVREWFALQRAAD